MQENAKIASMDGNIRFAIHTLGCKVNQYESDKIAAELAALGWERVDFASQAEVYIINSCTVTSVASHKSRQLIRRATKGNPGALVVVVGCYAESDRAEIEKIKGVGLIVGNELKAQLPRLLSQKVAERFGEGALQAVTEGPVKAPAVQVPQAGLPARQHTRALVKVQDGCINYCTYCIVPYVRGELWSRPAEDVIAEVQRLAGGGTQEIVLTGIHLGLYGAEKRNGTGEGAVSLAEAPGEAAVPDLGTLLAGLVEISDLGRVRLSSIELNEVSPKIIELMSSSAKVCNHLHIPLQSGSNRVLERMNRHYTKEEFIKRAGELKDKIPNLALTTDVIVGFPGETEEDFKDSIDAIEQVGFSRLHVFKFSPRRGTPAATYPEQVPSATKDARSATLIDIGRRQASDFAAAYVGKTLSVLIERRQGEHLAGVSDNYIRVYAEGPSEIIGKIADVEITGQEEASLYGKVLM